MEFFLIALAGLVVLIGAAMLSRRTGIAAPLLLVVLGIAASLIPPVPTVDLEPEWILSGVLPPLLYASSVRLPVIDLRRNLNLIFWLSIVMVFVGAVVIGGLVHLLVPAIPLPVAIALGAVISPTDAVAATSIGKRLGLPHRLMTVLEGESLFNDASALVALRTAVAAIAGSFSFWHAAGSFAWAVVGGVVVGLLIGRATVGVRAHLGDPVLATTVSFAVPWLAFFPAEEVHGSGVIAVVVAGVTAGHSGVRRLSAVARQTEATNWSTVNFILENAVFLVMGMQVGPLVDETRADGDLRTVVAITALVFGLMVLLRFVGVGASLVWLRRLREGSDRRREQLDLVSDRLDEAADSPRMDEDRMRAFRRRLEQGSADLDFAENEPITKRGGFVLAWAGMRGVVTLAAALTIPVTIDGHPTPYRSAVVLIAFTVAVISLVLFGGTLPWLIRRLDFPTPTPQDRRAEMNTLLGSLTDSVVEQLGPLKEQTLDGEPISPELANRVLARFVPLALGRSAREGTLPKVGFREQAALLQRRYLAAFRNALLEEQAIGAYSTETLLAAQRLLDQEEARLDGGL